MSEGRLFQCRVEDDGKSVIMRVSKPKIQVAGKTWDDAYERLIDAIIEMTGDGEPRVAFGDIHPTQREDRPYVSPLLTCAYAQGDCKLKWMTDQLFSLGVCKLCGTPRGKRNRTPLIGETGSSGDYCTALCVWDEVERSVRLQHGFSPVIVSERFLKALTASELAECDWIAVLPPPRARTRYFECIPKRFVRPVGHRNWEAECTECDACHSISLRTSPTGRLWDFSSVRITDWYAHEDTRKFRDKSFFAAGNPHDYTLVWQLGRARELAKSVRGMPLFPFGALPRAEVLRRPPPVRFSAKYPDEFKAFRG
jgi:hypothetical protein